MNFKHKLSIISFMLVLLLLANSCVSFVDEKLPPIYTMNYFENDEYLYIDSCLINKKTKETIELNYSDTEYEDRTYIHQDEFTYKFVFNEFSFVVYTFVVNYYEGSTYLNCVYTFDYNGNEIDKKIIGNLLSKDEVIDRYQEIDDCFSIYFRNDYYPKRGCNSETLKDVNNYVSKRNDKKYFDGIYGFGKPVFDKIWFSVNHSNNIDIKAENALMSGMKNSEILSYDPATKEFESVFKYEKKYAAIIDFDENGVYVYDINGDFSYYDFKTKKTTLIANLEYQFHSHSFSVRDKYISFRYENRDGDRQYIFDKQKQEMIFNGVVRKYVADN